MQELVDFYSDLYCSKQGYFPGELQDFLQEIELPFLHESQSNLLDDPITIEEIQIAVNSFPNSKAPGDDGVPIWGIQTVWGYYTATVA